MRDFKLANVLTDVDEFLKGHADLVYRADVMPSHNDTGNLVFSGTIDFLTYFNALSLAKWRRYASIDNVELRLELAGDAVDVVLDRVYAEGESAHVDRQDVHTAQPSEDVTCVNVDIPLDDAVLVGFSLHTNGTVRLKSASFWTSVDEDRIRPIRLALCTTTFKNEQYITPNIEEVKANVLASDDPIAQAFHMFVVDNGRTLDADALSDDGVTVCPNDNVGGSGGFARGMVEALNAPEPFTHVLLMDDDVKVSPESFKRTFNLLSLANETYASAFINGAMLQLQNPNIQFEDVSYVRKTGGYDKFKPNLNVADVNDLVRNETISVEGDQAYGAWWYSCIPVAAIKEHGLPLPLFIRGDDVEFGVRCKPTYMTMGGICVWHSQFVGRFRASVDGYQYVRNMLIVMAVDQCSSQKTFMMRYWRVLHIYLRMMNYDAAGLWLDGLEDYLKGPVFLATVDGSALMKSNGAKNEKLVPVDQLDQTVMRQIEINREWLGHEEEERSSISKVFESLPHDRHYLPLGMLKKQPAIVDYSGSLSPWRETACRSVLVALDGDAKMGHIRTIDKPRYEELIKRYRALKRDYNARHAQVEQDYRDAFPHLTSEAFWREYLGL